jgi:hypothetical protein
MDFLQEIHLGNDNNLHPCDLICVVNVGFANVYASNVYT